LGECDEELAEEKREKTEKMSAKSNRGDSRLDPRGYEYTSSH